MNVTFTNSLTRFRLSAARERRCAGSVHIAASYSDYPGGSSGSSPALHHRGQHLKRGRGGLRRPGRLPADLRLPLVDAGDPAAAQGLDLAGNPLVADGNDDGTARRDIGAYELPAPPQQPPPDGGGQGADTQAPVLSRFASTRKAFAKRTRFRYTLSEAARVTIRIQRSSVLRGHRRYRTVATIARTAAAGRNSTGFSRKVGRRLLRAGGYRAVALATDAAHNRSAPRRRPSASPARPSAGLADREPLRPARAVAGGVGCREHEPVGPGGEPALPEALRQRARVQAGDAVV